LRRFALFLGTGAVAVAAATWFMDPFDMYHDVTVHGVNHFRARNTGAYDRMAKAWQIRRQRPEGLLLGTSRVDWALDPHHPALRETAPTCYNAGLAGATVYEMLRYLQHAQQIQPLRQVVWGVDLESFNPPEDVRDSFAEGRLAVDPANQPQPLAWTHDLVPTLLTMDALRASRETWRRSRSRPDLSRADLLTRGNPALEDLDAAERRREYQVGIQQAGANLSTLRRQQPTLLRRYRTYEQLLAFAHEHQIDLHMFITPYHSSHLDVIRLSGNTRAFEAWKWELADRNRRVAEAHGREPFPLWDFSGYHEVATNPSPTPDHPDQVMPWYRDSSHYRKITGDMILDRMFGRPIPVRHFGYPLTVDTYEFLIRRQRVFANHAAAGLPPPTD
jgi:hypothetical protein